MARNRTSLNKVDGNSVFAKNSVSKISRTLYYRTQNHFTTFDAGRLIPIFVSDVIPGDNFKFKFSFNIKSFSPFVKPVMDDLVLDIYSHFTPYRLVDKNFEKIYCNYKPDADYDTDVDLVCTQIKVPGVSENYPNGGFAKNSVADYLDIAPNCGADKLLNHYWVRAYVKNWDEWFRPQFLMPAVWLQEIPDSGVTQGWNTDNQDYNDWALSAIRGGMTLPVAKTKDYFTTSLPFPQVGEGEFINLGSIAPVVGMAPLSVDRKTSVEGFNHSVYGLSGDNAFLRLAHFATSPDSSHPYGGFGQLYNGLYANNQDKTYQGALGFVESEAVDPNDVSEFINESNLIVDTSDTAYARAQIQDVNRLAVDLSKVTGISIRELRWVFQSQLIKELDLFGNRLFETIQNHFSVVASDARFQRSEFLGHKRFVLPTYQVTQNNAGGDTPMGTLSSYLSAVGNNEFLFNKSFPEPGVVIVYATIRVRAHTYSQGCNRFYRTGTRLDFAWPALTTVGDQEIYTDELYFNAKADDIWGYNTRYAHHKFLANRVSGLMRPSDSDPLNVGDLYTFADFYTSKPYLSSDFIWEDKGNIDRAFAVPSSTSGAQFLAYFHFDVDSIRMTMSGIPGLVDHSHRTIW